MSLYDRLVPAEALRWGRLTVERMTWHWEMAVDPNLPPGIIEFRWPHGRVARYPLVEFDVDERGPFADENQDAWRYEFAQGAATPPEAFQAPCRSWLPWRKRR